MRESKKAGIIGGGVSAGTVGGISAMEGNLTPSPKSGRNASGKSKRTSKSGTQTAQTPPAAALRQITQSTLAMGIEAKFLTVKQGYNKAGEFGVQVWIPNHEFIGGNLTVKDGLL